MIITVNDFEMWLDLVRSNIELNIALIVRASQTRVENIMIKLPLENNNIIIDFLN